MYDDEAQIDISQLRYVLYARKSTDDPQRQLRTIDDQIDECRLMAERLGIKIVKVVTEKKSAKVPGRRPEFTAILQGIRAKKYDAIIAWNPDRLARNMKEGGEIIDLVDENLIKDLKFVTHHFTSDANGKMLLGMAFVLSKQYSDKLSQDVTRGVRRGLNEGKSTGTPKHGYIRGEDGIYRRDGKNFELICKAWQLRKEGRSLEAIAQYMNEHGYGRAYKDKAKKAGQIVRMTDKILSGRVFIDPFYYGVLVQKGKQIDLREVPGYDFQPATDEETYNYVQSLTGRRARTEKPRVTFKPLVGMVVCGYCNKRMIPQTPTSGRKSEKVKILSYRCDTVYCPRKNKELGLSQSVRAKVIFDFMYDMLDGMQATEQDYERLVTRLETASKTKLQDTTLKIHSKQGALKSMERDIKSRSLKLMEVSPSSVIFKTNEKYLLELEQDKDKLADELAKLQGQVTDPAEDLLTFQEFLNVANNAGLHLRAADVAAKDRIARLIYLNVVVDTEKVVDYQIREPFKTYFQMQKISIGRLRTTLNEPTYKTVCMRFYETINSLEIKWRSYNASSIMP